MLLDRVAQEVVGCFADLHVTQELTGGLAVVEAVAVIRARQASMAVVVAPAHLAQPCVSSYTLFCVTMAGTSNPPLP